ncbi:unnamed protein product [Mycena citricolor]|uniref:Skg3/CAF120-like PH-like domain-containing protein n=1 Tax=Mycena citricolor TaxID=2018698 RepID=A0AAD2Q2C6_9AGAR|nr:unnamed protein product [Mycena citricolor]
MSASPQWDSRNQGYVSPARLRKLKETARPRPEFNSVMDNQSQRRPPLNSAPVTSGHTRSSSFFSFNRKGPQDPPAPQRSQSYLLKPRSDSRMSHQQPAQSTRSSLDHSGNPGPPPPLHPEIRSVVQLTNAHAKKIYFSGPLVRHVERQPDGQKPSKDDGWTEVWAQLGGTTLSIWDMKEIQEASAQGREVPPTYVNTTDAFVHVLGSVTVPETAASPAKRYPDVLTLNTAGSNLLLFSCPNTDSLLSWAAALRLCSWEKSRLEEIYTAHLLRITLNGRDYPTTLQHGRMEGWARIRIAGQTDWKKVWMTVSAAADSVRDASGSAGRPKKRMSNLFSSKDHGSSDAPLPVQATIAMYPGPKPKERRKALLTFSKVTQGFAVYPERPDLISRSTLIKLEGVIGEEETANDMAKREGWLLFMPELENGLGQAEEMIKWIVAIHDAFGLYGRPQAWTWDPRDPASLMFGYPVGPNRELLFLDREQAETLDVRDDRTSSIRNRLLNILLERMPQRDPNPNAAAAPPRLSAQAPSLPAVGGVGSPAPGNGPISSPPLPGTGPQLPPLAFGSDSPAGTPPIPQSRNGLSPITERNTSSFDSNVVLSPQRKPTLPDQGSGPGARPLSPTTGPAADAVLDGGRFTSSPTSDLGRAPSPELVSRLQSPASESQPGNSIRMVPPSAPEPVNRGMNHSPTSVLTSPHSLEGGRASAVGPSRSMSSNSRASALTSPFSNSNAGHAPPDDANLLNEAGALYYMQLDSGPRASKMNVPRQPTTISEGEDESEEEDDQHRSQSSPVIRQATPTAFHQFSNQQAARASSPTTSSLSSTGPTSRIGSSSARETLGRKPSGARAQGTPAARGYRGPDRGVSSSGLPSPSHFAPALVSPPLAEEDSQSEPSMHGDAPPPPPPVRSNEDLDVLAALSYLDVNEHVDETVSENQSHSPPPSASFPDAQRPTAPLRISSSGAPGDRSATPPTEFKSSFAPSRQAAERKAKLEAQQAAHQAAAQRPGRSNGRRKSRNTAAGGWGDSSEEEEEEEEDDDDDADSDVEPSPIHRQPSPGLASMARPMQDDSQTYSHLRPPRTLPQIPPRMEGEGMQRRVPSEQFSEAGRRTFFDDGTQLRTQNEMPQPGAARQTVWSQVLDPGRQAGAQPPGTQPRSDAFVQLEENKMTKAFTPQGLLSAGMQDREDRSAKRQEELARESGASLINVANKPPPPQTGLLGAITAHERERKREGGVGMFTPQQMFAAQQAAAQAYQQAMVAFSTAGSQVGGDGQNMGAQQQNPMMSMYDPRMSMMGMPMMGGPMGMQMTGMSTFNAQMGPNGTGSPMEQPLTPPNALANQGQYPSRTSSPARGSPHRGSPLIRPVDDNSARPLSPRPPT